MSIPFKDRRKGVRGGPRALQGISVDTRPSQQRRILSNDGFEFAMPRASPGPLWSDSDTLEGRSGLRWDVREDSLRPSALSKARLDARGHSGTESREPPTYQRIKAADRVDKATSNQICSPVVMASSKGLSSINNIGGRCLRSILRISGQFGGQPGGFVGQWLYVHRRR